MTSKKQLLFAYGLAINLFIISIVCYTAFPNKTCNNPIRLMYTTTFGKVFFDHDTHQNTSGYGIACQDCHHHPIDDNVTTSCKKCHIENMTDLKHLEYCTCCHELDDVEDTVMITHPDALHKQCKECHENIETGPKDCSQCHIS